MLSDATPLLLFGFGFLFVLSFIVRFSIQNAAEEPAAGQSTPADVSVEGVTGWQVVCCLLAVPIVYTFEQYFFEAVTAFFYGIWWLTTALFRVPPSKLLPNNPQTFVGLVFSLLAALALLVLGLVVFVIGLIVGLIIALPAWAAYWLAVNPGPPRYLLDLILVWYVGMFLYGVLFPLVWRAVEPVVAMTLGEVAFQRARHRVYGDRPRYSQPFYLAIAVVGMSVGGLRIVTPYAGTAVNRADSAWRENISANFYTPTPRTWPKEFSVQPGQVVATGLFVPEQNEVAFTTTADVIAEIGPTASTWILQTNGDQRLCPEPSFGSLSCVRRSMGAPRAGELRLRGGRQAALVAVYGPPERTNRRWLAAGETYRPPSEWFDEGDGLQHCVGAGLSYRIADGKHASRWLPITSRAWTCGNSSNWQGEIADSIKATGLPELRADRFASWVDTVAPWRQTHYFLDAPGSQRDTKIPVRPGDSFVLQNESQRLILSIPGGGTAVLPPSDDWGKGSSINVTARGTIRYRTNPANYGPSNTYLAIVRRGPEWK